MTEDPPSADLGPTPSSPPVPDQSQVPADGESAPAAEEVPDGKMHSEEPGSEEESGGSEADQPVVAGDASPAAEDGAVDATDEMGESQAAEAGAQTPEVLAEEDPPPPLESDVITGGPEDVEDLPTLEAEDVSLFVAPAVTTFPVMEPERERPREMGWKMMAAAGVLLLVAGFGAGVIFPDGNSTDETESTTSVATVPAAESTTPTTAPQAVISPSTTAASAAPSTTGVTPTTSPDDPETGPDTDTELVEPPDLVVTDEPVADVANRLIPSVVHLEIQSDTGFQQGAGSGVIFDSRGYILTAAHVVSLVVGGEADLTIRLSNGDRLPGEVVGTDPDSDIAVVKVERTGLTPAELALDDPPVVGQLVVAVGSPWGLVSSVTGGVVSAVDRIVDGKLLVQSDAVLYPGNSGGALADRYGRVIGINVSIFTDSNTFESIEFQGVGFSVPIEVGHRVAQALIAGTPVHTAFLGITGRDTQGDAGVEIIEVFPESGAALAGLEPGDVVVGVGGRPVTGIGDLAARIRHLAPGDLIVLNVKRGEESLTLAATLLPRSEVMADQEETPEEPPEE